MNRLAQGWSQQKTDQALACFTEEAIYMEPPDTQFYKGHSQLRPYFGALKPGTFHDAVIPRTILNEPVTRFALQPVTGPLPVHHAFKHPPASGVLAFGSAFGYPVYAALFLASGAVRVVTVNRLAPGRLEPVMSGQPIVATSAAAGN